MEQYRKETSLSDTELSSFRTIEINKIKVLTNKPKKKKLNVKALQLIIGSFIVLAVTLVLSSMNGEENVPPFNPFSIRQVSASEYIVESVHEDKTVYFYYKGFVAYHSETESFNDTFDYKQPFTVVPESIAETISIELNGFQLGESRFFLENIIEGESYYSEVDIFSGYSSSTTIVNLDIVNFEEDMKDIFELIELYPPVEDGEKYPGRKQYIINPSITDETDQRLIDNYTTYVTRYYLNEDDYTELDENDVETFVKNCVVLLDENNNYVTTSFHSYSYDKYLTFEETPNTVNETFNIYPKDESLPYSRMTKNMNDFVDDVYGQLGYFKDEFDMYAYIYIDMDKTDLDFEQVAYVRFIYKLLYEFDPERTLHEVDVQGFMYNNLYLVEPLYLGEHNQTYLTSGFTELIIELYDEDDNLIKEIQMNQQIQN